MGSTSVTTASTSSQLGGAAVGGVLFGGAGAVVGTLVATKSTDKVCEIALKINVADYDFPCWVVRLRSEGQIPKHSKGHKDLLVIARQWHGRILAIQQSEEMSPSDSDSNPEGSNENRRGTPAQRKVDDSPFNSNANKMLAIGRREALIAEGKSILAAYETVSPDAQNSIGTRAKLRERYEKIRTAISKLNNELD